MLAPCAPLPAEVSLYDQRLTFATLERLDFVRQGDLGLVRSLRMTIDEAALVRFLGAAIAGGPVGRLGVRTLGPHELALRASAFGLPLHADLGLRAEGGRVLMSFDSASAGWIPLSGRFLRDQILASSQRVVLERGWVRGQGSHALSFDPDYLFSHVVADFPVELRRHGLPDHLKVYLKSISLAGSEIRVEGGR